MFNVRLPTWGSVGFGMPQGLIIFLFENDLAT